MSRASVELDFFGMEKDNFSKCQFQKFLHRRRSFKGLQGAISKMNPEVIKSVISSGLTNSVSQDNVNQMESDKSCSVPSSPKETRTLFPVPSSPKETRTLFPVPSSPKETRTLFPVPSSPKETRTLFPALPAAGARAAASENAPETTPLTIFYNGTVSIFNVPRDKAESILKLAVEGNSKYVDPSSDQQRLLETLDGDLPIARRKSLQRFLEKRKKRLTCASPYAC